MKCLPETCTGGEKFNFQYKQDVIQLTRAEVETLKFYERL